MKADDAKQLRKLAQELRGFDAANPLAAGIRDAIYDEIRS
jgi:hypothetical protein